MNDKLLTALSGLGICSALLAVGLMLPVQADSRADRSGDESLLVETLEVGAAEAVETVVPADHKQARKRATLSMPYFSFAQSLRPRG